MTVWIREFSTSAIGGVCSVGGMGVPLPLGADFLGGIVQFCKEHHLLLLAFYLIPQDHNSEDYRTHWQERIFLLRLITQESEYKMVQDRFLISKISISYRIPRMDIPFPLYIWQ